MTLAIAEGERAEAPPYASLREAILGAVELMPDGRFIHVKASAPQQTSTFRETLAQAIGLAAGLSERGMRPGDGLILNLRESAEFIPALWAAAIGGYVAAPLAEDFERRFGPKGAHELLAFMRTALERATLVTDDASLAETAPLDSILFDELAARAPGAQDLPESAENGDDRLYLAIATSGATGRPKMVGLKESAVLARWWPKMPDAENASTFLSWSPYDHVMGLGLAAPNLRCKVHLDAASFVADPLIWLNVMEETRASHATMTNFGLSLIVRALDGAPEKSWRLDGVRKIGVGAEPVSPALCRSFLERLAPFGMRDDAIILGYGLTECGPVVGGATAFGRGSSQASDGAVVLDRPTAGHAVRVVGDDGGVLDEPCVGAIEVRGPTMACGYIGDKAETSRLFTSDGWLRTGDLGFLDHGRLAVVGREKELIFVNARKYSCQEIEEAIKRRGRFSEVYAAPLTRADAGPDASRGKPFAVFIAVDGVEKFVLAEVADKVRGILASTHRFAPEAVALIDRRDTPRTPLGKVQRLRLAAMLQDSRLKGHVDRLELEPPRLANRGADDDVEGAVASAFAQLLRCREDIDPDADFFALGGDSILALQLSLLIERKLGLAVPLERLSERVSIGEISKYIRFQQSAELHDRPARPAPVPARADEELPESIEARLRAFLKSWPGEAVVENGLIRRVRAEQAGVPVFWCMPDADDAVRFAAVIGARRPAFAMRAANLLAEYGTPAAKALAKRYVEEIRIAFPQGPYLIAGNCQGAIVALEVARDLIAAGRKVQALIIADTPPYELFEDRPFAAPVIAYVANRSKFNPHRKHRFPAQGLKKLLPAGCRMTVVSASYSGFMADGLDEVGADLGEAIAWAEGASATVPGAAAGAYPNGAYHNAIVASVSELTLKPGEAATLRLQIYNRGWTDWQSFETSGIAVGNHWLSPHGDMLIWSDARTPLLEPISAGGSGAATLTVIAPGARGRYFLEIDLVEEGVRWFGEKTAPPLHIPVIVEDAAKPEGCDASARPREHKPSEAELAAGIRAVRSGLRRSGLPVWRKLSAKLALSLARRVLRD